MEERATEKPTQNRNNGRLRHDLALIGLLLLAAVALRVWHLRHTEVAARDSIGYIRYAWQLGHHPWVETVADPRQDQHFGYPLAILGMSYPMRLFYTGPDALLMQYSAQFVSSLASVLLVVPMYFLGRDLFSRGIGIWATLIFQCLPAAGRLFADGLSEGVFLLLAATALFGAVRAFRAHSPRWFAVIGTFGALSYLVRPEGALIVAATGLVLLVVQAVRSRRAPWRRFLACGMTLSLTAVVAGCPLYAITGRLVVKPTPNRILHNAAIDQPTGPALATIATAGISDAPPFAVWIFQQGDQNSLWGVKAVGEEFVKGTHHVLWLPMLLGLGWFRDRFRMFPGAWVLLLVSLTILFLLWRVATLLGYVSDRHLLLALLCGGYWAVAAVPRLVTGLAALAGHVGWLARLGRRLPAATNPLWAMVTLVGMVASTLPKTLEPLHANRRGFREAGLWIADHSHPWDAVVDPYAWSHYYSGKIFLEDQSPAPPPGESKVRFVVLEGADHEHVRLSVIIEDAKQLAARGHKVWERTTHRGKDRVELIVYEAPSD